MKIYTEAELWQNITKNATLDETDNQGQIVIYTGIYMWEDGTFRDEEEGSPDPSCQAV
jgi:hypothetical protein